MSVREALAAAIHLVVTLDPQVVATAGVSLRVAVLATFCAALFGVPFGFCIAVRNFRGRRGLELGLKTLTAVPTVVVGLLVYMVLSRRGPLGAWGLLYTQTAMVIGETILITPLMAALTVAVVS